MLRTNVKTENKENLTNNNDKKYSMCNKEKKQKINFRSIALPKSV